MKKLNIVIDLKQGSLAFKIKVISFNAEYAQMYHLNHNLFSSWNIVYHLIELDIDEQLCEDDFYLVSNFNKDRINHELQFLVVTNSISEANKLRNELELSSVTPSPFTRFDVIEVNKDSTFRLLNLPVNNKMKHIREEQQLGVKFISNLLEITEHTYAKYEKSDVDTIPKSDLEKIVKAFGIEVSDLKYTETQLRYGLNSDEAEIERVLKFKENYMKNK